MGQKRTRNVIYTEYIADVNNKTIAVYIHAANRCLDEAVEINGLECNFTLIQEVGKEVSIYSFASSKWNEIKA